MTLERVVAAVLSWGTLASTAVIATGLALGNVRITNTGIAALIALPVVRVVIMLVAFARARDARAAAIAACVLLVLVAGFVIGLVTRGVPG